MHIVYIHQHFATPKGTTGTRSYDFARYWISRGHRVTVITGYYGPGGLKFPTKTIERRRVDGIDVVLISVPYENRMSYLQRIISFLKFMSLACYVALRLPRCQVVYATSTPLTVAIPGFLIRLRCRCPMVFEVRDLWPEFAVAYGVLRNPVLIVGCRALARLTYHVSHSIVSISPFMSKHLLTYGLAPKKIHTIPIGTDISMFDGRQDGKAFRYAHGLEDRFICMYVGAISMINSMERFLDVAAHLRDDPRIAFVFIGAGKSVESLNRRIRNENLHNVRILPPVPRNAVPEVLAAADLTLLSGQQHKHARAIFPNKLFDYLAAGKAILTNFESVTADLIRENNCGFVMAEHTPMQIAQTIQDIAEHRVELAAMGRRARELAVTKFDRRILAGQVLKLLFAATGMSRS